MEPGRECTTCRGFPLASQAVPDLWFSLGFQVLGILCVTHLESKETPEVDARGTPPRVYTKGKDKRLTAQKTKKRLTFTFPFVHHQSHDWKVEH